MQRAANEMCLARLKDRGLVELMPVIVTPASGQWERREVNILTRRGNDQARRWHEDDLAEEAGGRKEGAADTDGGEDEPPPIWQPRSAGVVRAYRWSTINELYWIIDAATAIVADAGAEDVALLEWLDKFDTAARAQGKGGGKRPDQRKETPFSFVEPDGYLLFDADGVPIPLFLESDRDTEAVDSPSPNSWKTKMLRYGAMFRWWDKEYPYSVKPLVLTVTTTATRREKLRAMTKELRGKDAYWFATEDQLAAPKDLALPFPDALGPIWLAPHHDHPHALRDHLTHHRERAA
jgi:hypothetical protein